MANRNYNFQKAHKNKEARLRWVGVQPSALRRGEYGPHTCECEGRCGQ